MIPTDWLPCIRPGDGELLGYLVADGELVIPMSRIGLPLGTAQTADAAALVLQAKGLQSLAERFWCRLPVPVTSQADVTAPTDDWQWRPVLLVEAWEGGCDIRPELASPEELTARVRVPVPVGDFLRAQSL
jgi:hypothetical protein